MRKVNFFVALGLLILSWKGFVCVGPERKLFINIARVSTLICLGEGSTQS